METRRIRPFSGSFETIFRQIWRLRFQVGYRDNCDKFTLFVVSRRGNLGGKPCSKNKNLYSVINVKYKKMGENCETIPCTLYWVRLHATEKCCLKLMINWTIWSLLFDSIFYLFVFSTIAAKKKRQHNFITVHIYKVSIFT